MGLNFEITNPKTSMTIENSPFDHAFAVEHEDFPESSRW